MAIDTHSPSRLSSCVDKAKEIFLASLDFPCRVCAGREIRLRIYAVEKVVGCAQWTIVNNVIVFLSSRNIETSCMLVSGHVIVIRNYLQIADQDTSQINVVVGTGRSLDDNGALNTVRELSNEMAVIPGGTIRAGNPLVDTGITWCQTALGNTRNTILVIGTELTDTVPMDGGRIVAQGVGNSDLDSITPVAHNGGSWNLTIDGESGSWGSLIVPLNARDGKVVLANSTSVWDGRVGIGVDAESVAPCISATRRVAAVVRDRGPGLGAWAGCTCGPD